MAGQQDRGVRNKVRQVVLIDGHPDYLYEMKTNTNYTVVIGDESFSLGKSTESFINHLKEVPGFVVESKQVEKKRVKGISGFKGLVLRKTPDSTTIQVSAKDEDALLNKIDKLRERLLANGIEMVERCSWVCTVDKADQKNTTKKEAGNTQPKDINHPTKQEKSKQLRQMVVDMGISKINDSKEEPNHKKIREVEHKLDKEKKARRKAYQK